MQSDGTRPYPMDAKEAARLLKMNSRTLVRWARSGYVPAHPLGEGKRRIWRFFEAELLDWVEGRKNHCACQPSEIILRTAIDAHAEELA